MTPAVPATAGVFFPGEKVIPAVAGIGTPQSLRGLHSLVAARARVLTAEQISDHNDFGEAERVRPQPAPVAAALPAFEHTFPAHSLTVIELDLGEAG